jgi:hypothetical protein
VSGQASERPEQTAAQGTGGLWAASSDRKEFFLCFIFRIQF